MRVLNLTPFKVGAFAGRMNFPRHSVTIVVKATFKLVAGGIAEAAEDQEELSGDQPYEDAEEASLRYESDFAYFKPRADLLLVGKCHPAEGRAVARSRVSFRVGERSRSLTVFGDRTWEGSVRSGAIQPVPFEAMGIRYERAFGGPESTANPTGKGLASKEESGATALPNIEDPEALIKSPKDTPAPAGFGPLARTWALRTSKLGTYDERWLEERWPWFPRDIDWAYFNAAPPEMQADAYLNGDEEIELENLRSKLRRYRSQLPGLRVRCFVTEKDGREGAESPEKSPGRPGGDEGIPFRQVPMNLDTLWVDAEAEKLVLVWRGFTEVRTEEFEEIDHLFVLSESVMDEAKSIAAYRRMFTDAVAAREAARNPPPESPPGDPEAPELDVEAEMAKVQTQIDAELAKEGLPPQPRLEDLEPSEESKKMEAEILREFGIDADELGVADEPATRESVEARVRAGESLAGLDLTGLDLSSLDLTAVDLQGAILTDASLREATLVEAKLGGAVLAGADLTRAKLSRVEAGGADFSGATLRLAELTAAVLERAVFDNADLSSAVLDEISAPRAVFVGADFAGATLRKCNLEAARLTGANLDKADLSGANLKDATLNKAHGERVNLTEADLTALRAAEGCSFPKGSFMRVRGRGSIWEKANLAGADFSGAELDGADFTAATLEAAVFDRATLKKARFVKAKLVGAKLTQVNLFEGNFERADLTRADLSGSNLYGAEFLDARLEQTNLRGANLKMTKLAPKSG